MARVLLFITLAACALVACIADPRPEPGGPRREYGFLLPAALRSLAKTTRGLQPPGSRELHLQNTVQLGIRLVSLPGGSIWFM